jgi:hypothetical protein
MKTIIKFASILATLLVLCTFSKASYARTYTFCGQWAYMYRDQGMGEDYLLHIGYGGNIAAAKTWASISNISGTIIWSGYLNSSGCSPAITVPLMPTGYKFGVTTLVSTSGGGAVRIWPNSQKQFRWFAFGIVTDMSLANRVITAYFGIDDPLASVAAMAVKMSSLDDGRFKSGLYYNVYGEEGCDKGVSACYDPSTNTTHLGTNQYGQYEANNKTIVGHELGHHVMSQLFGLPKLDYTTASTVAMCNCNQVTDPNLREHCLQSQEPITTAQTEGFAQFIATDTYNKPNEANATFLYYKELLIPNGSVLSPPVGVSAYNTPNSYRHLETYCSANAANGGVELDWLTFYWELKNMPPAPFGYGGITAVYKKACGNALCTNANELKWATTKSAVDAVYGSGSTKYKYWIDMGAKHGVDN